MLTPINVNGCVHFSVANISSLWIVSTEGAARMLAFLIRRGYMPQWFPAIIFIPYPTKKLNTTLWSMTMRNRFNLTEHRKLKIPGLAKAQNFVEQLQAILSELANGNLTASEATQLSKLVEVGMKVFEVTELEKRVTQIEQAQRIGVVDEDFKLEPEKI